MFSSLPKVFDSIGVLPLPTTIPNDGEPSATGTGAGKKKPTKKRPVKSEKPRKGSGTGCKKPRLESLSRQSNAAAWTSDAVAAPGVLGDEAGAAT